MFNLNVNKLTAGLESHRSLSGPHLCLQLVFPGFLGPRHFAAEDGAETSDAQHDKKSYVTSGHCHVTLLHVLLQICQPSAYTVLGLHSWVDDIIFPQPPMAWAYHTYSIMLSSVHCISQITGDRIFDTSQINAKSNVSCHKTKFKLSSPCVTHSRLNHH